MSDNTSSRGTVSVLHADFAQRHFQDATRYGTEPHKFLASAKQYAREAQSILRQPQSADVLEGFLHRLPSELNELMKNAPDREEIGVWGMLSDVMNTLFAVGTDKARWEEAPELRETMYSAWRSVIAASGRQHVLISMALDMTRRELGNQRHDEPDAANMLRVLNRALQPYPGLQENMLSSLILNPSELPGMMRNADIAADHYDRYTTDMLSEASASAKQTLAGNIHKWVLQLQQKEKYEQAARLIGFMPYVAPQTERNAAYVFKDDRKRMSALGYTDFACGAFVAPSAFIDFTAETDDRIVFVIGGKLHRWNEAWALAENPGDKRGSKVADRLHNFMFSVQDTLTPAEQPVAKVVNAAANAAPPVKSNFDFSATGAPQNLPRGDYEPWSPDGAAVSPLAGPSDLPENVPSIVGRKPANDRPVMAPLDPAEPGGATILAFPAGPRTPKPAL